jgi:hypothetical protein
VRKSSKGKKLNLLNRCKVIQDFQVKVGNKAKLLGMMNASQK